MWEKAALKLAAACIGGKADRMGSKGKPRMDFNLVAAVAIRDERPRRALPSSSPSPRVRGGFGVRQRRSRYVQLPGIAWLTPSQRTGVFSLGLLPYFASRRADVRG